MSPAELLALADTATPGPWEAQTSTYSREEGQWWVTGPEALGYECEVSESDARLIALAPDLARLCAEMGEALEVLRYGALGPSQEEAEALADPLLAKLSELEVR